MTSEDTSHCTWLVFNLQNLKFLVCRKHSSFSNKQVMILEKPYKRNQDLTLKLFLKEFWKPSWTVMFTPKRSNLTLHSKFLKNWKAIKIPSYFIFIVISFVPLLLPLLLWRILLPELNLLKLLDFVTYMCEK